MTNPACKSLENHCQ